MKNCDFMIYPFVSINLGDMHHGEMLIVVRSFRARNSIPSRDWRDKKSDWEYGNQYAAPETAQTRELPDEMPWRSFEAGRYFADK